MLNDLVQKIKALVSQNGFGTQKRSGLPTSCPRQTAVRQFDVYLYEHSDMQDSLHNYTFKSNDRTCVNLLPEHFDRVSSIDSNDGCIIVFAHLNCQGIQSVITPGTGYHMNFWDRGFNDETRSIRVC